MQPDSLQNPNECIVAFGDVHYAQHWDSLSVRLSHWENIINPNSEFRKFASDMSRAERKLKAINMGDAVDYSCATYTVSKDGMIDNRKGFYATSDAVGFTFDEILGNHDYRIMPYNLRFWGLQHINVSDRQYEDIKHDIGHRHLRHPLDELRSIFQLGSTANPLESYRGFFNPGFSHQAGFDCIYLNTGSDAFAQPQRWLEGLWNVIRNRRDLTSKFSIDCSGLSGHDLYQIRSILKSCNGPDLLIFMHAPVLNSLRDTPGREFQLDIENFRAAILSQGLGHHVMASGGGELVDILLDNGNHDRNAIIIAGHTHSSRYILIDRRSLSARQVELAELNLYWSDTRYIKHVTVLPLGVIDQGSPNPKMGYGIISHGGFEEVVTRQFTKWASPRNGSSQVVEVAHDA